jgi:hypothetical protein
MSFSLDTKRLRAAGAEERLYGVGRARPYIPPSEDGG